MERKTSGTWWVFPLGALTAFRSTCVVSGLFTMADGTVPPMDPTTAVYMTSDMVANLAANNNITLFGGDTASARKLLKAEHAWKQGMDLEGALAHPHLGKTMPSKAVIVAAYEALNASAEIEI
jgi:hypothetical protein